MTPTDALTQSLEKAKQVEDEAILAFAHGPTPFATLTEIDIINESSVVSDADCAKYVRAVQTQISRDYFQFWGIDAHLIFIPKGGTPDPAHWWMVIADDSSQANALGYHYTSNTGKPLGIVAAKADLDNGSSVSVTLSHEICEQLTDPEINLCVQLDETRFVAYEPNDPVENDSDGYLIGDVLVSNFVLPSYFTSNMPHPYDFRKLLFMPMPTLRPDGYLSVYVLGQGWTQINLPTNARMAMRAIPHVGSRRQRRTTPRNQWLRSTR